MVFERVLWLRAPLNLWFESHQTTNWREAEFKRESGSSTLGVAAY